MRPNTEISTVNDRKYRQLEQDNKKLMKKLQNKEGYLK